MNVLYSTDESYWPYTFISIHSLLKNNPNSEVNIYILCEEIDSEFESNLSLLYDLTPRLTVEFLQVGDQQFESVPQPGRFTKATYYRLLANEILPSELNKVLYLDGDTLINSSLDSLYAEDLSDTAVAAVPHRDNLGMRYGIPIESPYINTGVLLINLKKWEEISVPETATAELENYDGTIDLPLQAILNKSLAGHIKPIHPRYNYTSDWMNEFLSADLSINPVIYHYTGKLKPWRYRYEPPYKELYQTYMRETPYADDYDYDNYQIKMVKSAKWALKKIAPSSKAERAIDTVYRELV